MSGAIGPGEFALGVLLLAAILGAAATSAILVVGRRLDHLRGAPRLVAASLLTIAGTLAIHLLPLVLGVLSRGTVLVAAALLVLAASRLTPSSPPAADQPPTSDRQPTAPTFWSASGPWPSWASRVSWALAGAGVLVTLASWLGYLETHATIQPTSVDLLGFHLPGVIRFIQTGSLWQTAQYLPGQAQGNYPQYGDLLLLASALPWHSMALVRYVDPLLLGVAGVSVYAIARELRAPPPAAILVAVALLAIRPTLGPALVDVLVDPLFLTGFGAGALFLLRHWRTGARSDLLLSGLGLGIAFGTKWYGLTDVPALLVVWISASLLTGRPRRRLASDAAVLIVTVALCGGIWLLRNLILTGNPVFELRVSLFGATIFPAPPDLLRAQVGHTLAEYFGDPSVLRRYVWPVFRADFGLTGALIFAGALLAGALALSARLRSRAATIDPRVVILLVAALLLALAYALTPYSAQGLAGAPVLVGANTRYGVPALLIAAPLLAWLAGRVGPARLALEAALLTAAIVDLHRYLAVGTGRVVVNAGLIIALGLALWKLPSAPHRHAARARAGLGVGLACIAALVAYHYQRVLARRPYMPTDPTIAYVLGRAPAHTRIAVTGLWTAQGLVPATPLFGPRFENDVGYVGRFVAHRLEQYTTPVAFVRALRAGHYTYLEIGTGFPARPNPVPERWARQAGFTPVTQSARLILMRAPIQ